MAPPILTLSGTLSRLAASSGLALTLFACGGPAGSAWLPVSTFPSDVAAPRQFALTTERTGVTFPLLNGSLRVRVREGGSNAGTITASYTGNVSQSGSGKTTATLNLQVRKASGVVSDLKSVDGSGAFIGEGDFALSLSLASSPQNGTIPIKVQGTTTISCSAEQRILATLRGTGSSSRLGDIEIELQHEVGNTNCFP